MNKLDWQLLEDKIALDEVEIAGINLTKGDRVILKPKARGDIFDIVLKDKTATIEAIEQDYENKIHLAVTIDDDPGNDLGMMRQPGHRFFFALDEVEPFAPKEFEELK